MPSSARTCCASAKSKRRAQHLERAYGGDPYSATTVNTLRLLDTLRDFSVDRAESPAIVTRHQ